LFYLISKYTPTTPTMRPNQLPLQLITIASSLLPSLLVFTPFACADPEPVAIAEPEAEAFAEAIALPFPQPEALPNAFAELEQFELNKRQTVYTNGPFSGAIYIVGVNGANGAALTPASAAWCPNYAPQGCGNIGVWNWYVGLPRWAWNGTLPEARERNS
jgi:hypothetical protein